MFKSLGTAVPSARCSGMTRFGVLGTVGQPARATQDCVIALFRDKVDNRYLDDR